MAGIALEVASSQRPQMDENADELGETPMTEVESLMTPVRSYYDNDKEVPKTSGDELGGNV